MLSSGLLENYLCSNAGFKRYLRKFSIEIGIEMNQNMSPKNMPLWHKGCYFVLFFVVCFFFFLVEDQFEDQQKQKEFSFLSVPA